MSVFRLDGKRAFITGAASGIGEAVARLFAAQGAKVVIGDIDETAGQRVVDDIGSSAVFRFADVADSVGLKAALDWTAANCGGLHVLVNNAGIPLVGNVEETAEADFDRVYRVNVKGMYLSTQAALPIILKGGGGVILNMASIASLIGIPERFAYSTSKGAVLSMTRSIATDYMNKNVRCNCICPARVHTPFVDGYLKSAYPGREQEMFQELSAYQPLGRMGTPEEVAQLALYLCSDEASFITGQAFPIDGGVLVL